MKYILAAVLVMLAPARVPAGESALQNVATSQALWTGVGVSHDGRVFVNYPRWSPSVPVSVAELVDGAPVAFPPGQWNAWAPDADPGGRFVCVQSVTVDADNRLWILDPASPMFAGAVPGGPKLVMVDLEADSVARVISFDTAVAPPRSYLNDVRVDTKTGHAYITDSGLGAIVVVDLSDGSSRRLLAEHASTKAEAVTLTIEGVAWSAPVHSDGIALDTRGGYVYYQALTGRTLYRVPTKMLRDESLDPAQLEAAVEVVGKTGASDGLAFREGYVYLSSLEHNAVRRVAPDGSVEVVVQDERLKWPDSFAVAPDGTFYVTTTQLHLMGRNTEPFGLWKFTPPVVRDTH